MEQSCESPVIEDINTIISKEAHNSETDIEDLNIIISEPPQLATEAEDPLIVSVPNSSRKRKKKKNIIANKRTKTRQEDYKIDKSDVNDGSNDTEDDLSSEAKLVQERMQHIPRSYQIWLCNKALEENIILYLETGCGKTTVAVMLIKELASHYSETRQRFKAVFLAPTLCLVAQQAEVLRINTGLLVERYYGGKVVDTWNGAKWQAHMDANDVLVMTPEVLYSALSHGFLKLESLSVLIFDECHHAKKSHPYAKIMRDHYHRFQGPIKPKIFGMTASPVTKKGVANIEDSAKQIQELECLLDSKVYTIEDRQEIETYAPTAKQLIRHYALPQSSFPSLLNAIGNIKTKYETFYFDQMSFNSDSVGCQDAANKAMKKFGKLYTSLYHSFMELGLWSALDCANRLLRDDMEYDEQNRQVFQLFLNEALQAIQEAVANAESAKNLEQICNIEDATVAAENGFITPKVLLLLKCLMEYKDVKDLRCIVFVDRVTMAIALSDVLNKISCLSFIKCDFLSGIHASSNIPSKKSHYQKTLEEFRTGKINLLVSTAVAEEGIDVPYCSLVIRFDLPKTVRSHIQSRGRARRQGSDYIILIEEDNQKLEDSLLNLMQSEDSMKDQTVNRTHCFDANSSMQSHEVKDTECFVVESTGAAVSMDSSTNLIYQFCSKLPRDKYFKPQPEFKYMYAKIGEDTVCSCTLVFPPNGPFRELVGAPKRNRILAKQAVCLKACQKLHEMGKLSDYLLPVIHVEVQDEEEVKETSGKKNAKCAGTKKMKELHGSIQNKALTGNWIQLPTDIDIFRFHSYLISFEDCQKIVDYSSFVLLVENEIDYDIANTEFNLHMSSNRNVTSRVSSGGLCCLDSHQIQQAKSYHELIFNGMFGKLLRRKIEDKSSGCSSTDLLLTVDGVMDDAWSSSTAYFLLPVIPKKLRDESDDNNIPIDWEAIKRSAAVASRLIAIYSNPSVEDNSDCTKENKDLDNTSYLLRMADGTKYSHELKGMAVLGVHSGRIYRVLDVLDDKNAHCQIKDAKGGSYTEYFAEKYGLKLKCPEQPLLKVQQTHRIHNLLVRSISSFRKDKTNVAKMSRMVELPPELCLPTSISNNVVQTLYLIPSFLYRFKALLMAGQLRQSIAETMPQCGSIRPSLIMEATTTLRCLEDFSSEGLELLGDSFLKYAVSRHLYLVYSTKHEGQLSVMRSQAVCNNTLHVLAMKRGLAGYIRDEPFVPEHWCAPGLVCNKSLPCKCHLRNVVCNENQNQEAPLNQSTTAVFRIGKTCREGHRWMCSKTISDGVEALIGAFLVDGGMEAALCFMKWMGMEVEFDTTLIQDAMRQGKVPQSVVNGIKLCDLEQKLGYVFVNKSLLVEAITHASFSDPRGGHCCYQRLEFLGDAVLDFLITRHMYSRYPGLSPGTLSDLRSAAVNNECFARLAVKHNLHSYFRHTSSELMSQVTCFIKALKNLPAQSTEYGWDGVQGPKVLGDIFESIAGAIFVDCGFDLEKVWGVMKKLLSPLVTPETLPLHPVRELHELCQERKFSLSWKRQTKGSISVAIVRVEVDDDTAIEKTGWDPVKKTAKKIAAQEALSSLMKIGIYHSHRNDSHVAKTSREFDTTNQTLETVDKVDNRNTGISVDTPRNQSGLKRPAGPEDIRDCPTKRCKRTLKDNTSSTINTEAVISMDTDAKLDLSSCSETENNGSFEGGAVDSSVTKMCVYSSENHSSLHEPADLETFPSDNESKCSTSSHDSNVVRKSEDHCSEVPINMHSNSATSRFRFEKVNAKDLHNVELDLRLTSNVLQPSKNGRILCSTDSEAKYLQSVKQVSNFTPDLQFNFNFQIKGMGRASLNTFCMKNKWTCPVYKEIRQQGEPHCRTFVIAVEVTGPLGVIECISDPMPRKDQAKDDAALKLLCLIGKNSSE